MQKLREALGTLAGDEALSGFEKAFIAADKLNAGQMRKGTKVPYISHLLAVSALVMENKGTENERVAALLHDTMEDQQVSYEEIAELFGPKVADIVKSCSDANTDPKPPWRERKEKYLAHLSSEASEGALRVALADKVHNAGTILADSRQVGDDVWNRFNAPKDQQRWYFTEILKVMSSRLPGPMTDRLKDLVEDLFEK
ncbi:MAG: HD domain-containing protein [Actinomycetota bacterium]